MKIENWDVVSGLFDEALDLPASERESFLTRKAPTQDVVKQVLELLDEAERNTNLLSTGGNVDTDRTDQQARGTRLGNWEVMSLLGSGGMGEVYLVRRADGLYEQQAALKLMASGRAAALERFAQERQVLASLEHPGIGRLIDGGVTGEGRPFLVMERVEGVPIGRYLRAGNLGIPERLRLFLKVCEAVAHAHGRLVLHRDIKPDNILVSDDGVPRLIDFGVAALLGAEEADLRAPMTLRYAAPEQLKGQPVSVQTDVFGLGMLLHELLTGEPPERQGKDTLHLAPTLTRGMRAILDKALAAAPEARYASVSGLAADVQNYLAHRPLQAVNGGASYRLGLYLRRNWLASAALVAVIGALSAGLAGTYWQAEKAARERDIAVAQRDRLDAMQQAAFLLLAETSEREGDETTSEVVARSANRILEEFKADPESAAPTLHMYGELFFLMNDYPAAEPLLRAVADMDAKVIGGELKARAQYDLANVLLRQGKSEEARAYFAPGFAFFAASPEKYPDEYLESFLLESQLLNDEGRTDEARSVLEDLLPKRLAYSGQGNMDVAQLYTNLGVARMRTGDLEGAIGASAQARDIFTQLGRLESPDGLNTLNNLATLYHMTGRMDEAETAYAQTLETRQALFGPSAATAVLMSNYAKLLTVKGEYETAGALLDKAIPMADEYAGKTSPPALAARFSLIEARLAAKQTDAASVLLAETETLLAEAGMTESVFGGMQHLYLGQLAAVMDDKVLATTELDLAAILFEKAGPAAARYNAKVDEIRGSL